MFNKHIVAKAKNINSNPDKYGPGREKTKYDRFNRSTENHTSDYIFNLKFYPII